MGGILHSFPRLSVPGSQRCLISQSRSVSVRPHCCSTAGFCQARGPLDSHGVELDIGRFRTMQWHCPLPLRNSDKPWRRTASETVVFVDLFRQTILREQQILVFKWQGRLEGSYLLSSGGITKINPNCLCFHEGDRWTHSGLNPARRNTCELKKKENLIVHLQHHTHFAAFWAHSGWWRNTPSRRKFTDAHKTLW